MCIDEKIGVNDSGGCVLNNRMWGGVVQSVPVGESMGPYICADEILAVNCCEYIGEDCVDVSFDSVFPLLIWRGAFVSTLVFLVEQVCFVRAEDGIIVAP